MRELVCKVPHDNSIFYYEDGYYIRDYGNRTVKISAGNIPDPYLLWEKKCKAIEVTTNSLAGQKLRPAEVTFKLWEHKNANNNN